MLKNWGFGKKPGFSIKEPNFAIENRVFRIIGH